MNSAMTLALLLSLKLGGNKTMISHTIFCELPYVLSLGAASVAAETETAHSDHNR